MVRELYHPIIDRFVEYSDEEYDWLCDGGVVSHQVGEKLHKLRKIDDKEVLYIHGIAYIPLIEDDTIGFELEAEDLDTIIAYKDNLLVLPEEIEED
jgi:hypothetical protein